MTNIAQKSWLERVLGVSFGAPPGARGDAGAGDAPARKETEPDATASGVDSGGAGMAAWQAARGAAQASVKALEDAFRKMREPEVDAAIILLRAIRANLTELPATPAQVKALETYLNTDRIIREAEMPNGFGFKISLREPLLAALAALPHEQDAVGEQAR